MTPSTETDLQTAVRTVLSSKYPDLTFRQLSILMACETPQTVRGLSEALDIPKPAVTRAIQKLEGLGLANAVIDRLDRRSVNVKATRSGAGFLRKLAA